MLIDEECRYVCDLISGRVLGHASCQFVSFVICVPIRVSVDVLYCNTTEEDHRSVVETFA